MNRNHSVREDAVEKPRSTIAHLWGAADSNFHHDLAADPIHDHSPEIRERRKADRVLQLLDDLAVEKLRSENFEQRGAE